jgi:hypothetical protein
VSCLPLLDCHCSARHCRHPPIHAEYTSMLLSVHAIEGSMSWHVEALAITD